MPVLDLLETLPGPPRRWTFADDGATPNNRLPVLLYHLHWPAQVDVAEALERLFAAHRWPAQWRDGIFPYQHFHPDAHEVLGVVAGTAQVLLGGEQGEALTLVRGDVVVLPAGTGHRCLGSSADFLVVGGYPRGQEHYSIQRPEQGRHAEAVASVAKVARPTHDPVSGTQGELLRAWAG